MYDYTLDPDLGLGEEAMDLAASAETTDYETVLAAMEAQDGSDTLDEPGPLTLVPQALVSPAQALANTKTLHDHDVWCGIGMCLRTVRRDEFHVEALWPDAASAWFGGGLFGVRRHPTSDPKEIPRGAVGYWLNGSHGHVAPCFGGGLFGSTDIKRLGMVDYAYGGRIADWCGGHLAGWAELLNGVDVWPDPAKPKPDPFRPWSPERKITFLRNEARRERHGGNRDKARQFDRWADRIEAHLPKTGHHK